MLVHLNIDYSSRVWRIVAMDQQEIQHVKNCQFDAWYSIFKDLTPKSRILHAPEAFKEYLLSDGIHLLNDDQSESDEDTEGIVYPPVDFDKKINETIAELDGVVAPKLNWSAPRDAIWMSPTNNMKCINSSDVYILLKSSDYCTFDLTKAFGTKGPDNVILVLREWFDINPSLEFRCFIRDGKLVGAVQRDLNYYEFLWNHRSEIESLIQDFVQKLIKGFPDPSFVADVYLPMPLGRVWLIDINPWLDRTDTLLFDWDDLKVRSEFQLRLLEKQDATKGYGSVQHTSNYVPHDLVDMNRASAEELVDKLREYHGKQIKEDENDE